MAKQTKVRSIKFEPELEKKIRLLAAGEGVSFGEWVRRRASFAIALIEEEEIYEKEE